MSDTVTVVLLRYVLRVTGHNFCALTTAAVQFRTTIRENYCPGLDSTTCMITEHLSELRTNRVHTHSQFLTPGKKERDGWIDLRAPETSERYPVFKIGASEL